MLAMEFSLAMRFKRGASCGEGTARRRGVQSSPRAARSVGVGGASRVGARC